jgi:hypothetical protein
MIRARPQGTEPEVGTAAGERVLVEDDLLTSLDQVPAPAVDRVLLALLGTRIVPPAVDPLGNAEMSSMGRRGARGGSRESRDSGS